MPKKTFKQVLDRTRTQIKWWAYSAATLPFVALGLLGAETFFGYPDLFRQTLVAVGLIFFAVSVFWWWWAIFKIKEIMDGFDRTYTSLEEVKIEIIKTRQAFDDSTMFHNDSNR